MATNTEKPSTKAEQKKNIVGTTKKPKQKINMPPVKKEDIRKKIETTEDKNIKDEKVPEQDSETKGKKVPEQDSETKEKKKTVPKNKKDYAMVNVKGLPISPKDAKYLCKFIKNKRIPKAIKDLEEVLTLKKPVPMKGEIPHRKGKIMSGRFPIKAAGYFIMLLKSLQGNANMYELENPVIIQAIPNIGQRPLGRGGIKRKRTHVSIKAMEKKIEKGDQKIKNK